MPIRLNEVDGGMATCWKPFTRATVREFDHAEAGCYLLPSTCIANSNTVRYRLDGGQRVNILSLANVSDD